MPKLYEYFGLVVLFYSNEHDPVHVHGLFQGRECRASIIVVEGRVERVEFSDVRGRKPLESAQMKDFRALVEARSEDIVSKWVDYFVLHKKVEPEIITRRI